MRIITGLSIAALTITAASTPAFGKAHAQPADPAQQFGQEVAFNSFDVRLDARAMVEGTDGGEKGVDGKLVSTTNYERGADTVTKPSRPR
jgi:hypothetical protein